MLKFVEFVDKKQREAKKQLKIVKKLLESKEVKVRSFIESDDPFLYAYNPKKNTFFEGIRIYKIGDQIAFRVQKDEKTEPYGRAYPLDIEEMFEDFVSDYEPQKAGKKVIEAASEEVKKFFEKSATAEKEMKGREEFDKNPYNKVIVRSQDFGASYNNLVYSSKS